MTQLSIANPTRFDNLSAMTTNQTDDLYVEYLSPASCEEEFIQGGTKWIFCWAKYSNGKRDLGVYSFAGDVVYAYQAWQRLYILSPERGNCILQKTKGDLLTPEVFGHFESLKQER